jgi:hypothetical protein
VYLPLSSSTPIFFGGAIRWVVEKFSARKSAAMNSQKTAEEDRSDSDSSPGVLFSSGLIAGGAISGIVLAILSVKDDWGARMDFSKMVPEFIHEQSLPMIAFSVMMLVLLLVGTGKLLKDK